MAHRDAPSSLIPPPSSLFSPPFLPFARPSLFAAAGAVHAPDLLGHRAFRILGRGRLLELVEPGHEGPHAASEVR